MIVRQQLTALEQHNRQASIFSLVGENSGAKNSTVNEVIFEAGGHMPPHSHSVEETLVFLSGEGILFIGQEPHSVCAGTTLVIPANTPHCFYNTGIGRARFISFSPTSDLKFNWLPGLFPESHPLPDEVPDASSQDVDDPVIQEEVPELDPIAA